MSMGRVIDSSQKCHTKHTLPTIYRGPYRGRRNAISVSPPPVRERTMKTRSNAIEICSFPEQFTGGQSCSAETPEAEPPPPFLFGAIVTAQKCPDGDAPRGAKSYMQKCHSRSAPRQVFWARRDTQKCHSACAQRGGSS